MARHPKRWPYVFMRYDPALQPRRKCVSSGDAEAIVQRVVSSVGVVRTQSPFGLRYPAACTLYEWLTERGYADESIVRTGKRGRPRVGVLPKLRTAITSGSTALLNGHDLRSIGEFKKSLDASAEFDNFPASTVQTKG